MILGGFTRICVNIHHPALAASFRDVARLKRTEQGRVALGVTPQSSHRSGRADCPHPARHPMNSLTCAIRRRCVDMVSGLDVPGMFPSDGSWDGTPFPPRGPSGRFPRFDGTMRRSDSLPPFSPHFVSFAWRYHRCVRRSSPSAPDAGPWIILELVSRYLRPAVRVETAGSPKFPGNPCDHSPCSPTPA